MDERGNVYYGEIIAAQSERTLRRLAAILILETAALILALLRRR